MTIHVFFQNQSGVIEFAAGTLGNPPSYMMYEGLGGSAGFGLMMPAAKPSSNEFEALADGESPLLFQFDAPRITDITASGQSVLSESVGSIAITPTALGKPDGWR
jgi:hypothetical protein